MIGNNDNNECNDKMQFIDYSKKIEKFLRKSRKIKKIFQQNPNCIV